MQKELDEAQLKADKLGKKGGKANSLKVDNASQKLEIASSQWDSQAPFVFEKLQAVDESRLNHLRDVLTQYQTHEADQVERNRVTAETTLNSLLEVDTSQEIQNFARNTTQGKPKVERNARRTSSSAGSNTLPPPPIPKVSTGDGGSEHSGRNEGPSGVSSLIHFRCYYFPIQLQDPSDSSCPTLRLRKSYLEAGYSQRRIIAFYMLRNMPTLGYVFVSFAFTDWCLP
jgi:hypothetical protein